MSKALKLRCGHTICVNCAYAELTAINEKIIDECLKKIPINIENNR